MVYISSFTRNLSTFISRQLKLSMWVSILTESVDDVRNQTNHKLIYFEVKF